MSAWNLAGGIRSVTGRPKIVRWAGIARVEEVEERRGSGQWDMETCYM
jgi:hypothetical protein